MDGDDIEEWISRRACDDGFDPVAHGWTRDDHDEERGPPLQNDELEVAHSSRYFGGLRCQTTTGSKFGNRSAQQLA